jgi:hypothetical protein
MHGVYTLAATTKCFQRDDWPTHSHIIVRCEYTDGSQLSRLSSPLQERHETRISAWASLISHRPICGSIKAVCLASALTFVKYLHTAVDLYEAADS